MGKMPNIQRAASGESALTKQRRESQTKETNEYEKAKKKS